MLDFESLSSTDFEGLQNTEFAKLPSEAHLLSSVARTEGNDHCDPAEVLLAFHENAARNGLPSVMVNGDDPGPAVMIDPMVYQIVVTQPLRGPVTVSLDSSYAGSEIRYTLSGNSPTNTSKLYSGPLVFKANATGGHTCLKARVYSTLNSNLKGKIIRVAFRVIPAR